MSSSTAPNRLIAAFLVQKARFLTALGDVGGLFEVRLLQRLVVRERAAVGAAASEASALEKNVDQVRERVRRDLAPTDDTPGVIDANEARGLLEDLGRLGITSHDHAGNLKQLT